MQSGVGAPFKQSWISSTSASVTVCHWNEITSLKSRSWALTSPPQPLKHSAICLFVYFLILTSDSQPLLFWSFSSHSPTSLNQQLFIYHLEHLIGWLHPFNLLLTCASTIHSSERSHQPLGFCLLSLLNIDFALMCLYDLLPPSLACPWIVYF